MGESANRHSQQAIRRPYDNSVPAYSPQQPFYHPGYVYPYPTYHNHPGTSQYHQSLATQQWSYYSSNYYPRSPPPLNSYGQYTYRVPGSDPASFASRAPAPTPQNYPGGIELQQDASMHRPTSDAVPPLAASNHQIPPISSSEGGASRSHLNSVIFSGHRAPYYPPLPWLSVPEGSFPPKHRRNKRRIRAQSASQPVELPIRLLTPSSNHDGKKQSVSAGGPESTMADSDRRSVLNEQTEENEDRSQPFHTQSTERDRPKSRDSFLKALPARPVKANVAVPILANLISVKGAYTTTSADAAEQPCLGETASEPKATNRDASEEEQDQSRRTPLRVPPKSWAELLKAPTVSRASGDTSDALAVTGTEGMPMRRSDMMGQAIANFTISAPHKLSFLEPRGLINSGNMCYMNSILQALIFCEPFYNFLSHIGRHAAYSFNSNTPLLDAMIMFVKEFNIIDSADSVEKLLLRLKPLELEQFGDSLLPEYVYEAIRRMPRFATMQRGHQQDAEEFLGFLLEELQEECARAIRSTGVLPSQGKSEADDTSSSKDDEGWLEVGPRQKAATTRSSGLVDIDTPINHIFGGKLRSELRIPGARNSVTLEPYQSLQLDIGSVDIKTIVDALRGLTKPETLHGDFHSPRGAGATATKQVFIEELPSVLILHLKRFQYDNTGGTQKIWKTVGYPLTLEIPREVFPHSKRAAVAMHGGPPIYRLFSVIYHHGKSATVGHYTTDILRQDNREWLRIDDTMIRRVRSHEVEAQEEEPRTLATESGLHGDGNDITVSLIDEMAREGADGVPEKGWSQARGGGKKWSGVVDGTVAPSGRGTPTGAHSIKDSKVAYILFYEKVTT